MPLTFTHCLDSITRITPTLAPGTQASTGKNDINCAKQRAQEMIAIADPDFRAELTAAVTAYAPAVTACAAN